MDHENIRVESSEGGRVRTITLDRPKGNVITIAMCDEVRRELALIADDMTVSLVIVRGAGNHFSFGASVQEHLPETAERMLAALDGVILDLIAQNVPTLAAVEGRCLGGGLEVALACGFVFVAEDAVLGCPEIQLGVFAPAATALLARCLPRARLEELLLTGRALTGAEAVAWGLANRLVPRGTGAMDLAVSDFMTTHILPRSTPSLRVACTAAREAYFGERMSLNEEVAQLESYYLDRLLPLADAREGIDAFLQKRPPVWEEAR